MSSSILNFPKPRIDPLTSEKYYTGEDAMNLTPEQYEEWVYSNKTERVDEVRVYKTKFLNGLLTKSPPFLPLIFWPFVMYYLITPLTLIKSFWILIGFILWFPIEYLFHRFLFHFPVTGIRSQKFHFFLHGIHHVAPSDLWHVFSPPHELGAQAIVVWIIFKILHIPHPNALICGLLVNYLRYDSIHYLIHAYKPDDISKIPFIGNYLKQCSIHHRQHHFSNPRKHFTISFISSYLD